MKKVFQVTGEFHLVGMGFAYTKYLTLNIFCISSGCAFLLF